MSQQAKSAYYQALKAEGVEFQKHYRDHSLSELQEAWAKLREGMPHLPISPVALDPVGTSTAPVPARNTAPSVPVTHRDPNELAGARTNTRVEDQPIRIDPETGYEWFQEEVRKPAYPKPRGRRILRYLERGTKQQTVRNGEYTETFEVAGDGPAVESEVKITLPSYQVGIYKDRRFPFKIYVYNENRGFDFFEVNKYYGGVELVPEDCKRKYVENQLCYSMESVIRAIQKEYRELTLQGKVK